MDDVKKARVEHMRQEISQAIDAFAATLVRSTESASHALAVLSSADEDDFEEAIDKEMDGALVLLPRLLSSIDNDGVRALRHLENPDVHAECLRLIEEEDEVDEAEARDSVRTRIEAIDRVIAVLQEARRELSDLALEIGKNGG